ncbi:MAG: hypothetical protein J1E83_00620 [Lachnospiraceae bacterium]|nr:hypothetical protein [Lachnospiraceae bacterium]
MKADMFSDVSAASEELTPIRREYKDTLFRMLFNNPESLLSLYNAVNGTAYTDSGDLQIVTLENAIYMNMKNDLAFLIDLSLNLYEHQSSFNPNMPLRDLFYVAKEYQKLVDDDSLYSSKQVKIPTPRFVVFYNGTQKQPEIRVLRLSDAYESPTAEPELELVVTVYNINPGNNEKLLTDCPLLGEYMQYVERVRQYTEVMELAAAVERAVGECIEENILKEFLTKYRSEAIAVCIFEFDEEKYKKIEREVWREEGIALGIEQGLTQGKNSLRLLIRKMTEAGEADRLARLADEAFLQQMCEKYQI